MAQNVGTLRGTVTDPSAAVIPNATVVATSNGQSRSVKTDGQGKYTIPNVAPGKYDVRADAPGFVPYITNGVDVPATQATSLDIALQIAAEAQTVSVNETSAAALFDRFIEQRQRTGIEGRRSRADCPTIRTICRLISKLSPVPARDPTEHSSSSTGSAAASCLRRAPSAKSASIQIRSHPSTTALVSAGSKSSPSREAENFHGQVFVNYGNKVFDSRNPLLTTDKAGL